MKIVVGLGKSGLSSVSYLLSRGEEVIAMDTRQQLPDLATFKRQFPDVNLICGKLDEALLCAADEIILSPGLSLKTPEITAAIAAGVSVVGDIELFAREAKAPIIAITGSNGKTTVTTLVADMINDCGYSAKACGNIGIPVLELLNQAAPDFYVMELSSFQLETTYSLKAAAAVLLNLSADHMDRYETISDYLAAKQRIYRHCKTAVVPNDERPIWQDIGLNQNSIAFSCYKKPGSDLYSDANQLYYHDQPIADLADFKVIGGHHTLNVLATLALGLAVGLELAPMLVSLKTFSGLAHRCQFVDCINEVSWFNDSKATNVGSVVAALDSISQQYSDIILIAGGDAKGADLRELGPALQQNVSQLVVLGESAPTFVSLFQQQLPTHRVQSLDQAVSVASSLAQPGTVVLLSPACASWDMFKNYEERGNLFIKAVQELKHEQGASA